MLSNRSRGCQTPINLHGAASSRTHLVLQAYWLTDIDKINPLRPIHTGRRRQRLSFTLNGVTSSFAELNCGSVASLHWRCSWQKLKTFQLFKRQCTRQPIKLPYANTLAQTLANPVHATPEKYVIGCCDYDGRVSTKLRTHPPSSLTPTPRVNGAKFGTERQDVFSIHKCTH